jgi:hypothetical protein
MKKATLFVAVVIALTTSTAALAAKKKKRIKVYQPVAEMTEEDRRDRFVRFLVTPGPLAVMQFLAAQTKDIGK